MNKMLKKTFKKKPSLFIATVVVFIMVVGISAVYLFQSFKQSLKASDRETYHHIAKIRVNYYQLSSSNSWSEQNQWIIDSKQIDAIVTEINSLNTGGWFQTFGKAPAHETSLHLYTTDIYTTDTNHKDKLVRSFTLTGKSITEQGEGYRTLKANGVTKSINLQILPRLRELWCQYASIDNDSRKATHDKVCTE